MKKTKIAVLCGLVLGATQAMACYTVYDSQSRVIYQGIESPVDMSLNLHETLGRSHPGAQLVFDQQVDCREVRLARTSLTAARELPPNTIHVVRERALPPAQAMLLTDRATAARRGLPHTVVAGNIVAVPPAAAARDTTPAVTVIPSTAMASVAASPIDTRVMGGPPARSATTAPSGKLTVITEYRDGSRSVQRY